MNTLKDALRVTLFCGGRGSATIIHELLRWPSIQLTLLVNAYDDGLSTGALRNFITHMLGPSDFRKNLSYLIDPFSEGQYALKNLLEFRLPNTIAAHDIKQFITNLSLKKSIQTETPALQELVLLIKRLSQTLQKQTNLFLQRFFEFAENENWQFTFADCSVGNLLFAGAYLEHNHDFNAAANAMTQLASSRATLVNVSAGENRILVALQEDGNLLFNEAQIVGPQSAAPICRLFFLTHTLSQDEWAKHKDKTLPEKILILEKLEKLPALSAEAKHTLAHTDILIYGPGTQHSSLFPSYCITHQAIKLSEAKLKIFLMNLENDYDIQTWNETKIIERALFYLHDKDNAKRSITHIFCDEFLTLQTSLESYNNTQVIRDKFAKAADKRYIHNGATVVNRILQLWENAQQTANTLEIFIDMTKRSLAVESIYDECMEINWQETFSKLTLNFNHAANFTAKSNSFCTVKQSHCSDTFPDVQYFFNWLTRSSSDYLVILTGDGEYRFRDVMLGIHLLEQSHFAAVFGSRNQSRLQYRASLRAAYGEKKLISRLGFLGSFLISAFFALRFGMFFSDPLTGFRIFKRAKLQNLLHAKQTIKTPISLVKYMLKQNIEIAELPVSYRTFAGFTDPKWRIKRGLKNLLSTFLGRA